MHIIKVLRTLPRSTEIGLFNPFNHDKRRDHAMKSTANYKAYILTIVTVPFLGTGVAICSLWQQAVRWGDLGLLVTMHTLNAAGMTILDFGSDQREDSSSSQLYPSIVRLAKGTTRRYHLSRGFNHC
jgi:hypothetical protein